jgi:hypothetical protein
VDRLALVQATHRPARPIHQFEVTRLPGLVQPGFQQPIAPQNEVAAFARQRPDVEVRVVLERHADQVADRVLRRLGQVPGRPPGLRRQAKHSQHCACACHAHEWLAQRIQVIAA